MVLVAEIGARHMGRVFAALSFFCLCFAINANANEKDVRLYGQEIKLVLPTGYCFLSNAYDADRRLNNTLERLFRGTNKLLAGFADCQQLQEWRQGKRAYLDDYGQFLGALESTDLSGQFNRSNFAAAICQYYREETKDAFKGVSQDASQRIESVIEGANVDEIQFLGVLSQDKNGCYTGVFNKSTLSGGKTKQQFGVVASVLVRGQAVTLNLYTRHDKPQKARLMLALMEMLTGNLIAENER
jgi:hypothetical protein